MIQECPVCLATLDDFSREGHLSDCLQTARVVGGSRYVHCRGIEGVECSICFEELMVDQECARMTCLCVYHVECIEKWMRVQQNRDKASSCPVHLVE